ncbi:hypothetical protein KP509_13G025900 [Ceratopteris richardii]|uniref:Uncharacterized protein n=1 Tax=Ceratopteris richardii TaxID=49495 RepID=A0A8T2THP6_CERRI|nr:hypothetical protein KP509_13G025900 [Ceratopteris richardii]
MAMPASTRAVCIAWQALKQPPITFSRGVRFPSYTHPRHSASCLRASAGNSSFDSGITRRVSVPSTVEESIQQALSACKQARGDGLMKLQLELLLPLIGATDLDDWPGGIQQQFKAATPVVSTLLGGLTDSEKSSGKADLKSYILDDGDAVGVWESEKDEGGDELRLQ